METQKNKCQSHPDGYTEGKGETKKFLYMRKFTKVFPPKWVRHEPVSPIRSVRIKIDMLEIRPDNR